VQPNFTINPTSPSWKSWGCLMATSLSSSDVQSCLSSKFRLIPARTDVGIAVVASSMAYTLAKPLSEIEVLSCIILYFCGC